MSYSDLTPLSVVSFGKDVLVNLIRTKTGLGPRDHISQKVQLDYLCKYLSSDHVDAKTMVVEDEYVDRNYLEDFAEYYARCFSDHPKKCCRVHFFSENFSAVDFASVLENRNPSLLENIKSSYLGHAVIRPIQETFLGRLCLIPYRRLSSDSRYKLITRNNSVSLFGIELGVETTPFVEQDKVVSACATSALWTLLSASSDASASRIPSPSAITKSANHLHDDGTRTFPTSGLTPLQVTRSLKQYGLEPTVLHLGGSDTFLSDLQEVVWAYVNNDIPVLIGGSVYRVGTKKVPSKLLGAHFVCAVGHHLGAQPKPNSLEMNLLAQGVDKIYVHDDRYGPYVRLDAKLRTLPFYKPKKHSPKDAAKNVDGLALSLHGVRKDIFVPEVLIIGLYHKVRIPYNHIRAVCASLFSHLVAVKDLLDSLVSEVKSGQKAAKDIQVNRQARKKVAYWRSTASATKKLLSGIWDISLTTGSALKLEILNSSAAICFNSAPDKTTLLTQSMPKYLWRCKIFSRSGSKINPQTEIIFDATEVPQGPIMIGYITYTDEAEAVWQFVDTLVEDHIWNTISEFLADSDDAKGYGICVLKFFAARGRKKNYLNTLYGPLRIPTRELKDGELDFLDNVEHRSDVITFRRGSPGLAGYGLDLTKKYIWLINEFGDLVLGEDVTRPDGKKQGHPTLIDGEPARLGGELYWNGSAWAINPFSGAYSSHLKHDPELAQGFLANVINHNFANFPVVS